MEEIDKDKEISIDFGKVKKIFKKKEGKKESEGKAERAEKKEEISLNFSSLKNFLIRYKIIFLILIPFILTIFVRMQNESLPMTDDWAKQTAYNYYKNQIRNQIAQQYPYLPEKNKDALVEEQFSQLLKDKGKEINAQIKELSKSYKSHFQDENGYTYMPDIDPYYFLRYARNYLEKGYIGDEIRNGIEWDNHMVAPLGNPAEKSIHPYILAWLYKIMKPFNKDITPMQAASYFPIIFSALSVIPAFFIGRRLGGNIAGFFSSLMVGIAPAFVNRTLWGHADTDAYNIFFPLLIIWLFFEAFEQKDLKIRMIFSGIAGLLTGIYSFAWNGWWYVFDFILASIGVYFIYLLIINLKKEKVSSLIKNKSILNIVTSFLLYFITSAIFVSIFGLGRFVDFFFGPIQFATIKAAAHLTLWPNVYTTVAELNPASFSQIIGILGGNLLFFISILGILFTTTKKDDYGKPDIKYASLMFIWYIGIFYASLKGVRFTMMLVPPFALGFGNALGFIYEKGSKYLEKGLNVNKIITGSILIIIYLVLVISPFMAAMATAKSDIPIINDAWYNALNKIKTESEKNAIINSWWDFGHHFKYYADRAVTFDGGSQNTPMAHWIGKVLLTDDEELAVGILRMLDCGSNRAFEELDKEVNDVSVSVKYLYDLVKLDKEGAKKYLMERNISEKTIDAVLNNTHCQPPEDYFITSEDMIGKSGVWAHFGSWDFDKADIWISTKNMPYEKAIESIMKNMNVSKEIATKLYYEANSISTEQEANTWIAPWPSYAGITNCEKKNETISCENGITINLTNMEALLPTQQGLLKPDMLVYETADDIRTIKYNSTTGYSIALLQRESNYQVILMQNPLAKSMFTRLFFFKGKGLKHFKQFDYQRSIVGTEIYVWKISWK